MPSFRSCCVPGCSNRVKNSSHFVCPSCFHRWAPGGVLPPWLKALRKEDQDFERITREARQHEISLDALMESSMEFSDQ